MKKPFDSSILVHFRKRLSNDLVCQLIEQVNHSALEQAKSKAKTDYDSDDTDDGPANAKKKNKGKLLIDATCTAADITFPTDLKILNKAREHSEAIIDELHQPHKGVRKKPRNYRKKGSQGIFSYRQK